ncbi:MAG: lysylphosphatidylglycerol synthase transmembrane domain-containing protein [Candidatus Omnitrophica bacterium]|nr:lysylphosphatidylglycerol synthase transmembrane domain-containing protein [Candidatus Omnitrophota bacterium]
MKTIKQFFSVLLKAGISIALLWYLFRQLDRNRLLDIISHADIRLLLLAFCVFVIPYILALLRWKMLLDAIKMELPLKRIVASFSGGVFFNQVLPSSIGGDLMRSIDLSAHTKRAREVVATVLLDRLSGYIGLVIMVLVSLVLGWRLIHEKNVLISVCIITGLLAAIILALFNKFFFKKINMFLQSLGAGRVKESITSLHYEIHQFRSRKTLFLKNISLSLAMQFFAAVSFYIIARSIGVNTNFIYFLIFLPIMGAITMLPISIGGLGLRENTAAYLFPLVGVGKDLAVAMSLLNFFFILTCAIIGGLTYYVLTIHNRRLQSNKTPSSCCSG